MTFFARHKPKIMYLLVGGWNTIVWYVVFVSLYRLLQPYNVHYLYVLVISQIFSVTNAYVTNKIFVFETSGNYLREYVRFASYYTTSFIANLVVLPFLVEGLHVNPIIAQGGIIALSTVLGFIWHRRITFKDSAGTV